MRRPRAWFTRQGSIAPSEDPGGARKPSISVMALMAIVATCGLTFWAARVVRDDLAPVHTWSRMLRDGEVDQRQEAAAALAAIEAPQVPIALPALSAAVLDPDARVATQAIQALGQASRVAGDPDLGRRAVEALAVGLGDARPQIRAWTALVLANSAAAQLGPEGASAWTDPLLAALGDPDENVRVAATRALARVPCGEAGLAALEAILASDASTRVRSEAALALGSSRTDFDRVTIALLHALGKDEAPVREACDSALFSMHVDPTRRRSAAIVPRLTEALADPDPRVRCHAVATLGEIGPAAESSVAPLVAMLHEPSSPETWRPSVNVPIRWQAASQAALALGRIAPETPRAKEATSALIALLREGKDEDARASAAEALADFGADLTTPAVPLLLDVLKATVGNPPPMPPAPSICFALGRIAPGSPLAVDAIKALTAALDSADSDTRLKAAEALGAFGPRASPSLPRLRALAGSGGEDHRVVEAAGSAVRRIDAASSVGP
ncbi:HEAT repeat domain-containing protein [Paludisphaera soli]|uniref:HEAT repeat domain-containing protein n=1 Tax=Paludisphaera soli TaxID=2712865 RepID=UPI0013EA3350|nr:HEAT repeat domain-containing protein [Paludisphaera soli]